MRSQPDHFRIPARHYRVAAPHALTQLHERMLDMARMLFIVEKFGDLLIGEPAAEPGVPPKQKRHEHDQPGSQEKEEAAARGHLVMRRRSGLRRRIFRGDSQRIASLRSGRWTGHVSCGSLT